MKYIYYPGCTLETTALEYNESTRAAMQALGAELVEIEDWNCCGAAAAEATSHLLAMVLGARNLALTLSGKKASLTRSMKPSRKRSSSTKAG